MADPVADFLAREQDFLAEIEGNAPNDAQPPPTVPPTFDDLIEDPSRMLFSVPLRLIHF